MAADRALQRRFKLDADWSWELNVYVVEEPASNNDKLAASQGRAPLRISEHNKDRNTWVGAALPRALPVSCPTSHPLCLAPSVLCALCPVGLLTSTP